MSVSVPEMSPEEVARRTDVLGRLDYLEDVVSELKAKVATHGNVKALSARVKTLEQILAGPAKTNHRVAKPETADWKLLNEVDVDAVLSAADMDRDEIKNGQWWQELPTKLQLSLLQDRLSEVRALEKALEKSIRAKIKTI